MPKVRVEDKTFEKRVHGSLYVNTKISKNQNKKNSDERMNEGLMSSVNEIE